MLSIKLAFCRAAAPDTGFSTFWLLVFAIAILDDGERREERRKKRDRKAKDQPSPPAGPKLP